MSDYRDEPQSRSTTRTPLAMLGAVIAFLLVIVASAIVLFAVRSEGDEPADVAAATSDPTSTVGPSLTATSIPSTTTVAAPTNPVAPTTPVQAANAPTPESQPAEVVAVEDADASDAEAASQATGAGAEQASGDEQDEVETDDSSAEPARDVPLLDLLPAVDALPNGLAIVEEGPLTIEQAADLHPDPDAQIERLREWGFRDAARREFQPTSGDGPITNLIVAVVDFGSPEQARAALDAGHAEVKAVAAGATTVETQVTDAIIQRIGDHSLAAEGTVEIEGQAIAVAYVFVQDGSLAYTIVGLAPPAAGSPLRVVTDVALSLDLQ